MAYSVKEAAKTSNLSASFLRLEIKRGNLRVRRIGRRVLILSSDLQKYLESE